MLPIPPKRSRGVASGLFAQSTSRLPKPVRFILRRWYLVVVAAFVTYASSGIQTLLQDGTQAFWRYLLSWALVKPLVDRYPIPFFVILTAMLALVPVGRVIAREQEVADVERAVAPQFGQQNQQIGAIRTRLQALTQEVQDEIESQATAGALLNAGLAAPLESDELESAIQMYLRHFVRVYDQISLPIGMRDGEPLRAIFQPLELRSDTSPVSTELAMPAGLPLFAERRRGQEVAQRKEPPRQTVVTGSAALDASPKKRMIVLGSPGSGKSTVLKHMAVLNALAILDHDEVLGEEVPKNALFPIFISLADMARRNLFSVRDYLPYALSELEADARIKDVLWSALESGKAALYLDGLDEVSAYAREKIMRLLRLASDLSSPIVLSSRFEAYQRNQLEREGFSEWELHPLNHERRVLLAERLLPRLGSKSSSVDTFVSAIESHPSAEAYGESPLLFSLAAVIFVRNGKLPISRTVLYEQVIDAVLSTRVPSASERETLREAIGECALIWLEEWQKSIFTLEELHATLAQAHRFTGATWDVDRVSERIVSSGVLDTVDGLSRRTYRFRHQTFQEYFAARALANHLCSNDQAVSMNAWKQAHTNRHADQWRETLRLTIGVLTEKDGREATRVALQWLDGLAGQWNTFRRLAYASVAAVFVVLSLTLLAEIGMIPGIARLALDAPRDLGAWWWLVGAVFLILARGLHLLQTQRLRFKPSRGLPVVIEALSEIDDAAPFWRDDHAVKLGRDILIRWAKTLVFAYDFGLDDDELRRLGRDIRLIGGPVRGVALEWLETREQRTRNPKTRQSIGQAIEIARGNTSILLPN